MTQSTSSLKTKLIDFNDQESIKDEQRNCFTNAFNSLMLRIEDFQKYEEIQQFTRCQNCKMVLTDKDREYIDDWNLISQNRKMFNDIPQKINKMQEDPWNYYIWECRFCARKNLIKKQQITFAKNKSKIVIKEDLPAERLKDYCDTPLLLFLIDSSSSMQQQFHDSKNNTNSFEAELKNTKIYKKIRKSQEQKLKQIKDQYDEKKDKNSNFQDHISKNKALMALLQITIGDICSNFQQKKKIFYMNQSSLQRKVGFIFFNSQISIHKNNSCVTVSEKAYAGDKSNNFKLKADFDDFQELYEIGRNQSKDFGQPISKFSFQKIQVEKNIANPSGQTALGPALSIAAGMVSNYGSGSLIVVITDGKANRGIFRQDQPFNKQINLLSMKFQKVKSQICILQLQQKINKQIEEQKKKASSLQRFFRKNCQRISVQLSNKQSPIEMLKSRLRHVISKTQNKNLINQLLIVSQNVNVDYESGVKGMKNKLFPNKQCQFITPRIKYQMLKNIDYKYPFMIQILVSYQNIETKKQEMYMTYMIKKLIRYKQMSKKQKQALNSQQSLINVLSYIHNQEQKLDLQNLPLSLGQISFKSIIQKTMKMSINRQNRMQEMRDFRQGQFFPSLQQKNQLQESKKLPSTYKDWILYHLVQSQQNSL